MIKANIKKARRHFAHDINHCVDLITKHSKRSKIKHGGTWPAPHHPDAKPDIMKMVTNKQTG